MTFASFEDLHALHWCIPPSDNNWCCCLTLSTRPRFGSSLPALLPPVALLPAWQQGLAGKRRAESLGMCIHLSCSFFLETESQVQGARQRCLPPEGRAEIYKRVGSLPSDLSWLRCWENRVSEKSWQHCWLPPLLGPGRPAQHSGLQLLNRSWAARGVGHRS